MRRVVPKTWDQRTLDLALDEVTFGLSSAELEELLARVDRRDLAPLEHAVAAVNVAALGPLEAPPADFMRRLKADASAYMPVASVPTPVVRVPVVAWIGWAVAAALLVAFFVRENFVSAPSAGAARAALVAQATDVLQVPWKATDDPLAGAVSGDVVWSGAKQEGYMRFRGLPPNDPKVSQYQLWIFDTTRAEWEARPVDGGVFDVTADAEVVVPIRAKLEVREPKLFGVTLEAPGGVVVSKREHLLAVASL
ncbi:MAG: anti-sigma factor [Planctomycetes bacterium]|nr:anti-sigma factor [Planctomycetota bacterium]